MSKWYKKVGKAIGGTLISSLTGGLLGNDALGSGNPIGGEFGANFWDPLDLSGTTARKYQASQAEEERAWQEKMSNTAHQREMADLKAAGVNPIMTVNGGQGATSGTGASASGDTSNGAEQIASLLNAFSQIKNASTSAKATKSQADLNTAQEENVKNEIVNRNLNTAQNIAESNARISHINEQAKSEAIDNHINEMLGISRQDTGQTRQVAWLHHNNQTKNELNAQIKSQNRSNKALKTHMDQQTRVAKEEFDKRVMSKLTYKERLQYKAARDTVSGQNTKYKLARIAKQRGAFN